MSLLLSLREATGALLSAGAADGFGLFATYSPALVWHALSATFAWGLLAPLSMLLLRMRAKPQRLRWHGAAMLVALALTVQAYLFGAIAARSPHAPPKHAQHPMFAVLLVLLALLQALLGALRPSPKPRCPWREAWRAAHNVAGFALVALALYVLQHSVRVFSVTGWLRRCVFCGAAVGAVAWLGALLAALVGYKSDGGAADPHLGPYPNEDGYQPVVLEEEHACAEQAVAV